MIVKKIRQNIILKNRDSFEEKNTRKYFVTFFENRNNNFPHRTLDRTVQLKIASNCSKMHILTDRVFKRRKTKDLLTHLKTTN